jgi:subtilisin family serine protease
LDGSDFFLDAVNNLRTATGGVVVASAGNTARNVDFSPFYPASFRQVFSVAATDQEDNLAGFSNWGGEYV